MARMDLEFVEKLPKKRVRRGYTRDIIEDFLGSGHKYAKINDEYGRNSNSLCQSFIACLRRNTELRSKVRVHNIEGSVYLERID